MKQTLNELAVQLANRCIVYVGGKKPHPRMDCDLELWNLSKAILREVSKPQKNKGTKMTTVPCLRTSPRSEPSRAIAVATASSDQAASAVSERSLGPSLDGTDTSRHGRNPEGFDKRGFRTKEIEVSQREDWKRCRELWSDWMYHEAVESGYDASAAEPANRAYCEAFVAYGEKYGVAFNPNAEPETSILEDADELGLRVEYAKYLETCRGRGMDFEEWKANQEVMD